MNIFLYIVILLVGFVALVKGADIFVDGSSALAKNFKVPGVIIGLTIVAFGTSAPELAVSTSAALQGSNEIAFSNVLGSNTFNLLVVLGMTALISTIPVEKDILKRDFPLSIAVSLLMFALISGRAFIGGDLFNHGMYDNVGEVSRMTGIILLVLFFAYMFILVLNAIKHPQPEEDTELMPVWKCFVFIFAGVALVIGGGQAVVYSAKALALLAHMSETLVGLTIVAVGTSLPELVTSVTAAKKGETGMAVGNVVGSNMLNILLILGVSSSIHPIAVNLASVYDMIFVITISLLAYAFSLTGRKVNRIEGLIMLVLYVADVIFAAVR